MSTGAFESGKYKSNKGLTYPCRAQPETKELVLNSVTNSYPTESVGAGLPTISLSNSRRGFGVVPNRVVVELTANGTGAKAGYVSGNTYTLPWFDADTFVGVTKEQTGTYQGIACKCVSTITGDTR
jgi:hypothetical protein